MPVSDVLTDDESRLIEACGEPGKFASALALQNIRDGVVDKVQAAVDITL